MDSSKRVTSIFIAVALLALAALAISVSLDRLDPPAPEISVLPGLAENLRSIEKLTGYPAANVRVVRVIRTNGGEVALTRESMTSAFKFRSANIAEHEKAATSAILYANASFINSLYDKKIAFAVTGVPPEQVLGRLIYTGFDGLVFENTVFRDQDSTWLKVTAGTSAKLAKEEAGSGLLSEQEIKNLATSLQGRIYRITDKQLN